MSHQFRTPLAVIDSTAQRLLRTARSAPDSGFADSELVLEKMHLTRSTVEHMNKLIDSVLTSVRLESGALRLQAQRLNMDELVGKVISCLLALSMCAQPIGQAMYGVLFEQCPAWLVVCGASGVSALVALASRAAFRSLR